MSSDNPSRRLAKSLRGIQLADPSRETTKALVEKCALDSPFTLELEPLHFPKPGGLHGRICSLTGHPLIHPSERRRIHRLLIHTTCVILGPDTTGKGLTQDLSYTGLSILSTDFNPGHLWGAILHIKFVNLKAFRIGIDHRGADALVQFRVDLIEEG